jgi:hypothetical protein
MNQPKFKFGDKVFLRGCEPWEIKSIEYKACNSDGTGEFVYNRGFWESEMMLYQEPQKKKLYAYSREDLVVYSKNEKSVNDLKFLGANFKRDIDFDIDLQDKT